MDLSFIPLTAFIVTFGYWAIHFTDHRIRGDELESVARKLSVLMEELRSQKIELDKYHSELLIYKKQIDSLNIKASFKL